MATYYCDFKNGDDTTGNGSSSTPWKTLTKALASASNNDTILLRGSDTLGERYAESAMSTALTGLTIGADTGHTPVFARGTARTTWSKTAGCTNVYEYAGYPYSVIYVCWNGDTELAAAASVEACDAASNSYYLDAVAEKLYVNIGGDAPTCINAHSATSVQLTLNGNGCTVQDLTFQYSMYTISSGADNITIQDCTIRYCASYASLRTIIDFTGGSGHVVDGCAISGKNSATSGTRGIAIAAACSGVTVQDCVIHDCYYGIGSGPSDTVVTGCTFYATLDPFTGQGTVSYCTAYEWDHAAFICAGAGKVATFHHCIAYVPSGYTHNNWYGFVIEGSTCYLYHNVVYGATSQGYYMLSGDPVATVYNCVMMNGEGNGFVKSAGTLTADYNCAYNNATNNYSGWTKGDHDIELDPLFADAGAGDMELGEGSPCIDAGVAVAGINDDYQGSAPDIGAEESEAPAVAAGFLRRLRR